MQINKLSDISRQSNKNAALRRKEYEQTRYRYKYMDMDRHRYRVTTSIGFMEGIFKCFPVNILCMDLKRSNINFLLNAWCNSIGKLYDL